MFMMQKNRQRKLGISLVRGICGFFLTVGALFVSLYLGLLGLTALMRLKAVNDRVRRLSSSLGKRGEPQVRKFAGTRFGSLYFNLSVLKHVGRKSGRAYVTFLSAYPLGDGFVLTLAYGPDVDWCRNIMATGKCTLTWKGQEYPLEKPELLPISKARAAYPLSAWIFAKVGGMKQCLWVHKQSAVPAPEKVLVEG